MKSLKGPLYPESEKQRILNTVKSHQRFIEVMTKMKKEKPKLKKVEIKYIEQSDKDIKLLHIGRLRK